MQLLCTIAALAVSTMAVAQQTITLAGAWDFRMGDTDDKATPPDDYVDYVMLPGSMLTNDKGEPVSIKTQWTGSLYDSSYYFNPYMERYRHEGQMKFPFFLTPEHHYVGAAWYHRTAYISKAMKDQRITLFLERPHIETTVYVNGQQVGHQTSLSVPHRYDITDYVKFGQQNDIAIRVYNGIENVCVGQDSHSVTDQTQGNWNGIAGRIELQAQPHKLNIRQVSIRPDVVRRSVHVSVELENHVDGIRVIPLHNYYVQVSVRSIANGQPKSFRYGLSTEAFGSKKEFELDLSNDLRLWDEHAPNLYQLTVEAGDDEYTTTFGMRDISIQGRQLYINGRPLHLRGTVENCCFPLTGYPPTDEAEWLRIFRKCKEYGLNHVRFHSYCPPEAAFSAADRVGIYLQPEGPSWPNHGVKLRRGQKIDEYLLEESKRIIDEYGHHPSFVMMAAGNEPAGDWVTYCNQWVKEMKQYDPTKIYAGASVGGGWAWDSGSEYHVKGGARGLEWDKHAPSSDDDYYQGILFPRNYKGTAPHSAPEGATIAASTANSTNEAPSGAVGGAGAKTSPTPNNSPVIAHEQGQWCAFPDFRETAQYTGVYKARNFEIFQDLLRDHGMEPMADRFLMASGRLQTLCYKYEIERNLRTKDYAGFQLLGLNDYSGQGTALVGVLNVFWREKGYCTADQWRQFCSAIVPLARFPKFVFTNNETLTVPIDAYNGYGYKLSYTQVNYDVKTDDGREVSSGQLFSGTLPVDKNSPLGTVSMPLSSFTQPTRLTLTVRFSAAVSNSWQFWVYPAQTESEKVEMKNFYETDTLDEKALKVLKKGGSVLLTASGRIRYGNDVHHTFLPVFWNTSWFKMRPPHTTGAYIESTHPVFRDFPTDDWQNLNWWELVNRTQVMNLAEFPADYQPIVQPIDTWHVSRKLGMLVEARVLNGRLLMTTMDISNRLDSRPAARQLRYSILRYMQSDEFQPSATVSPDVIRHLFEREAPKVNMFTNESPDELKPQLK